MLVLTRKKDEAIRLGEEIRIVLVEVKGRQVRIGIECPSHMRVVREELYVTLCENHLETSSESPGSLLSFPKGASPSI